MADPTLANTAPNRQEAKRLGLPFYFGAKECPARHFPWIKHTGSRQCVVCIAARDAVGAAEPAPICQTAGCGKVAIKLKKTRCYGCYMRLYLKGTTDYHQRAPFWEHSAGYRLISVPGHPLVNGRDRPHEYEHRVVFYDACGAGPFTCFWCDVPITWDDLEVDHLNNVRNDNALTNLVASCSDCNRDRARPRLAISTRRANGFMITAFGRTQTRSEWAREVGIAPSALAWRMANGWSVERALSEPRGITGPPSRRKPPRPYDPRFIERMPKREES
jgi:hypothetical protein